MNEFINNHEIISFSAILFIVFLPFAIFIKRVFYWYGYRKLAYILALMGFVPILNLLIFYVSREKAGYKDGIFMRLLIFIPYVNFIFMLITAFSQLPIAKNKMETNAS